MQAAAVTWSADVAGNRTHRSLDGAAPRAVFDAVEAPALRRLPTSRFVLASWSTPKVGPDCHVKVGPVLYSVPWRHIGTTVDVRVTDTVVEVFAGGQLVKTHPRAERGRRTDWGDYPPEKVAFFMRTPQWCRRRAAELGGSVAAVVHGLLEGGALHHLRSAQGVIGLAERHSSDRLDRACALAAAVGDPSYRTVKGILAAGSENDGTPAVDRGVDAPAHLRGPAGLFEPAGPHVEEVAG